MPLMKIDMLRGRSKEEIKEIMDVSYEVMLETLGVPENDRYQIVTQHDENEMDHSGYRIGIFKVP